MTDNQYHINTTYINTYKTGKIYKTNIFRCWAIGSTGLWFLREGHFQGELHNSLGFLPRGTFQTAGQEGAAQVECGGLAELRREIRLRAADLMSLQDRTLVKKELPREGAAEMFPGIPIHH